MTLRRSVLVLILSGCAPHAFHPSTTAIAQHGKPAEPGPVKLDDVRVVGELPQVRCAPLGAEQVQRRDASVARAVEDMREGAALHAANYVVLDPVLLDGNQVIVFGRLYACPR